MHDIAVISERSEGLLKSRTPMKERYKLPSLFLKNSSSDLCAPHASFNNAENKWRFLQKNTCICGWGIFQNTRLISA